MLQVKGEQVSVRMAALVSFWLASIFFFPQYDAFLALSIVLMFFVVFFVMYGIRESDLWLLTTFSALSFLGSFLYLRGAGGVDLFNVVSFLVLLGTMVLLLGKTRDIESRSSNLVLFAGLFCILANLLVQVAIIFDFVSPSNFIIKYYYSRSLLQERYSEGGSDLFYGRVGGLIPNPNQAAKAITLFYCLCLPLARLNGSRVITFLLVFGGGVGISLTGSRSGLGVFLLTTFIFFRKWFSVFPASARLLFYALAAVGVSLIFWKSNAADRLMAGSYEDSLAYKMDYLLGYIEYASNRNFNSLVFGNGFLAELVPTHAFAVRGKDFGFDSDIGYMIYYLGIPWSGFFLLFLIYWFLVNREYLFAAPILLWMISSSIFFNVRSAMLFAGMVLVFKMLGPRGVRF